MTVYGEQLLDSYRLSQYVAQAPCYICAGGNNFDADLCRHCFAPMALAHQANTQKVHPRMLGVIGSAGAGKTVFLGMLTDLLSRGGGRMQMLARGAFSINLQQAAISALSRCRFPAKTPCEPDRWNWLHCQIKAADRKRPVELIMPDMSGEALLEEIDHPHTYPVIEAFLAKCAGVLLLVDASQLDNGEQSQDFFAMKLVSYLCELNGDRRSGWPNRPVSVVFTKADQCGGCFDNPERYAQRHAGGLWQQCQERLRRHRYFASGVAGACVHQAELGGRVLVPLRIEPHGIVEPFEWLVEQVAL